MVCNPSVIPRLDWKGALTLAIEVEALSVRPTYQRRGIGSMLLKEFLEQTDHDHAGTYLFASIVGRPLYERFGWKIRGESRYDLSQFGAKENYLGYHMERDGRL